MKSKLIVALDVESYKQATTLVRDLADVVDIFKVGSQLFTRVGPKIVEFIHERDRRVFLDLKFHDIPSVVAGAVEAARALGVFMVTVHAGGGAKMLKAAVRSATGRPIILGVTVLTSVAGDVCGEVLRCTKLAKACGLNGIVASPREIKILRKTLGEKFLIVTPGIRPAWAETRDQERVMTPAEAIVAGASYIVVGRPIVTALKPIEAAQQITSEMASAIR